MNLDLVVSSIFLCDYYYIFSFPSSFFFRLIGYHRVEVYLVYLLSVYPT